MKQRQFKLLCGISSFFTVFALFAFATQGNTLVFKAGATAVGTYTYTSSETPFSSSETTLGDYTKMVTTTINGRTYQDEWKFFNASYAENAFCYLGPQKLPGTYFERTSPTYGLTSIKVDYTCANGSKGLTVQTRFTLDEEFKTVGFLADNKALELSGNYFRIFASSSAETTINSIELNYDCLTAAINTSNSLRVEAENMANSSAKYGIAYSNSSKSYMSNGGYVPFSKTSTYLMFGVNSDIETTANINLGMATTVSSSLASAFTFEHNGEAVTLSGNLVNASTWYTISRDTLFATVNLKQGLNVFKIASTSTTASGNLDYIDLIPTNKDAVLTETNHQLLAGSNYISTTLKAINYAGYVGSGETAYSSFDYYSLKANSNATMSFDVNVLEDLTNEPLYARFSKNNAVLANTVFKVTVDQEETDCACNDVTFAASSGSYQLQTQQIAKLNLTKGSHKITVTYICTDKESYLNSFIFDLNKISLN